LWKHEVSQRVAAHRKRKGSTATDGGQKTYANPGSNLAGSSRISSAAARVAARYASAPSYSDLFAVETRPEATATEPVPEQEMLLDFGTPTVAAPEASTEIEQVRLSMPEAAPMAMLDWDQDWDFGNSFAVSTHHPLSDALERESHRDGRSVVEPVAETAGAQLEALKDPWNEEEGQAIWNEPARFVQDEAPAVSMVEPQPIHGNLIEFPYELVATRKVRPRRAEGNYVSAVDAEPQLSIFEVDPASISTQPDLVERAAEAPAWSGPEWADLKLEASQQKEPAAEPVAEVRGAKTVDLQAAPMNLRVLAAVVDFGLVSIASIGVAALVAVKATVLPTIREAEIGGAVVFAAIAVAYLAISYTLARATPGMKYALLSLRTFDGQTPSREQRCKRLGALALAMLPVGLGAVWALFDEQHLCWHDRWSGTYLKRV
jgi:uncharacterized RDD family membrane protein YckC